MIVPERPRSVNAEPRIIAARRLIAGTLVFAGMLGLTGCYAFIPTTDTALPAVTPVTIRLTEGGSVALQQVLGKGVNEVEGTVIRSSADSLVVAVEHMYTSGRQKFSSSGTTAAIPRPYIDQVQVRTFSRKRTTLMVLGGIAAAAVAGATVSQGGGNAPGSGGGTTPTSVRRP